MLKCPNLNHKQKLHYRTLRIHNLNHPATHDIRLCFTCRGLRSILLLSESKLISKIDEKYNKDLTLKDITLVDITLKITVHNTDRVTVMVAYTDNLILIDIIGVSRLSGALTTVKERLQRVIEDYNKSISNNELNRVIVDTNDCLIPNCMSWTVNMWHFGHDSSLEFTGPMFGHTWRESLDVFRIYSKKSKTKKES